MGKKGGARTLPNSSSRSYTPISLREEVTGKVQTKAGSNVKSILKFEHLKKLGVWASKEASIPSLGAFYGQHLATVGEAMGVSPDPSLVTCQRCETVLHPGFNCTLRIEKNVAKGRHRRKKSVNVTQNIVIYKCHFCSHQNLKRGTPKGHMNGICPSKEKSSLQSEHRRTVIDESSRLQKGIISKDTIHEQDVFGLQVATRENYITDSPATPSVLSVAGSLEEKKRKRNTLAPTKANEPGSMSAQLDAGKTMRASSKRRRKSWTSLKEIAQGSEHDKIGVANLKIPFFL